MESAPSLDLAVDTTEAAHTDHPADSNDEGMDEDEYEIEYIKKHRKQKADPSKLEYFVKWKGDWGDQTFEWIPEEDMNNATDLRERYWNSISRTGPRSSASPMPPQEADIETSKNKDEKGNKSQMVSEVVWTT